MDKNAIKKYAVWARRELITRVSQKALQYGISDTEIVPTTAASVNGVVLSAEEVKQRKTLIERIHAHGYEQTIEEVAYTWFNRFIALRFMEVNGYLPSRVRVFTDENNAFNPQILTEAIHLDMDGLDMEKVYAFKDANDKEGLFKYLLITQCNALSPILPRMFQRIADETELLFPDNLLRQGSIIEQMIVQVDEDDWKDAVQ
ncbi:MAG: SAM-dependent methyltransferase, partial [Faecousia sp.]